MSPTRKGRLLVISGPSGAGKTSICNALLERVPHAVWSVSCTTRARRGSEQAGRSYEYVTTEEFLRRKGAGEFLETAEYLGQWYGTPIRPLNRAVEEGKLVILEIEVQGGAQVARRAPDSIRIFVLPPTMETLKSRLEGRDTENRQQQERRLAQADGEIGFARDSGCYQYFVTNDILEDTVRQILKIIEKETQSK